MTNKHVISMKVAVATLGLIALPFAVTTVSADGDKTEEVTKETTKCVTQYGGTEECTTEVITEEVVHESKDVTHDTTEVNAGLGDLQASTLAVILAASAATLYTISQLADKAYQLRD